MSVDSTSGGGWPAGWAISAGAGLGAAILARWLGDTNMTAALLIGLVVLLVFGVLLGMFWTLPALAGGHHDHGHDDHHGHDHPALAAQAPATEVASVAEVALAEMKPAGMVTPRVGTGDPLQTIEGIGPVLEKLCHDLGIFHFYQIAAWGRGEVAWMDNNLKGFKGCVSRDRWVRHAGLIREIGIEAFNIRAKTNDY